MFDLDNWEIDFDDDFSSNLMNKCVHVNENLKQTVLHPANKRELDDVSQSSRTVTAQTHLKDKGCVKSFLTESVTKNSEVSLSSPSLGVKRRNDEEGKPKKRLSHEGLGQRKFPGPAGLLPDKPFTELEDSAIATAIGATDHQKKRKEENEIVIHSQSSELMFLEPAYQRLAADFGLNEKKCLLKKYTLQWVKMSAKKLNLSSKKIPFLGVVLHSVNPSTPDPVVQLRDPTGEISGILHREVWVDAGVKIHAGTALALRHVGMLITGVIRRHVYLNITMNNILAIYNSSENGNEVNVTSVHELSQADLFASTERSQSKSVVESNPFPSSSSKSLFSTVSEISSSASGCVGGKRKEAPQSLSHSDSLILEEVLNGIDLEEFEL